jgi:hypothetical protein
VKFADLKDNSDPQRLRKLPREESDKLLGKYTQAYEILYCAAMEAETCPIYHGLSLAPPLLARS